MDYLEAKSGLLTDADEVVQSFNEIILQAASIDTPKSRKAKFKQVYALIILKLLRDKRRAEKMTITYVPASEKQTRRSHKPDRKFGFRKKHNTIERIHRVVSKINNTLQGVRNCTAISVDVTQALDKVWHTALVNKIKKTTPWSSTIY